MALDDELNKNAKERLKAEEDRLKVLIKIEEIEKETTSDISNYLGNLKNTVELTKTQRDLEKTLSNLAKDKSLRETETFKKLESQYEIQQQILISSTKHLGVLGLMTASFNSLAKIGQEQFGLSNLFKVFSEADQSIRDVNLQLGLSGNRAKAFRDVLFDAAYDAQNLGVNIKDLAESQKAYADETGRLVSMSKSAALAIVEIGKGTGIGTAEAGKMAGQFELIGKNAEQTRDFYESVVDSSERFGINSSKVVKLINENFKKAQQYVFKGGVKGLADMAKYAEKFKLDMTGVFSAMDKARGLEGAVDMAAQLQIIGGEFAKTDPFQLLFQARNDAAGFSKTMQGLTANLATFNKQTREFDIAAGNLDRLRLAAEATGQPIESLIEQAKRGSKIKMIEGMLGGLTKENKEYISSIGEITKNGVVKITMPDGTLKMVSDLTNDQIKILREEKDTLAKRAKESQGFNQLLENSINSLKVSFTPALQLFSKAVDILGHHTTALNVAIAGLIVAFTGKALANLIVFGKDFKNAFGKGFAGKGKFVPGGSENIGGSLGKGIESSATKELKDITSPAQTKNIDSFAKTLSAGAKGMLAFGAAILLIGGGISIAAIGVSKLVTSFKGLTGKEALAAFATTIGLMGGFVGIMYAMIPAITALGIAGTAGSIGLLALGGSVLMIGSGIGIAAAGIGYLVNSFSGLITSLSMASKPDLANGILKLAGGVGILALGMTSLGNPLALLGAYALVKTLEALGEIKGLNNLGSGFSVLTTSVNSLDTDKLDKIKETASAISNMSISSSIFSNLSSLLSHGIEVKFAENEKVNLEVNVTAEIDGEKLGNKIAKFIPVKLDRAKKGV